VIKIVIIELQNFKRQNNLLALHRDHTAQQNNCFFYVFGPGSTYLTESGSTTMMANGEQIEIVCIVAYFSVLECGL
jgi:hypothetical protein